MARACSLLFALCAVSLGACLSDADPCEGVTCPADRVCIALERGTICACADATVEVEGECVDEDAVGEGEGE